MINNFIIYNNEKEMQFETEYAGGKAYLAYRYLGNKIAFMHTSVPEDLEGRGIAGSLAKAAFEYAAKQKKPVVVYCPFVGEFIKKHPEYTKQLEPEVYKG